MTNLLTDYFGSLFRYREYLKQAVARDLRKQYKRSFLGYLWSMLHPLLMMTILAVVFSNIMRTTVKDYAVFLFCGMLPWGCFDSTIQGCLGTIRANARIIDQVAVPKFIFPSAIAVYGIVNFLLSLIPLAIVMLVLGHPFHATILLFVVVLPPLFLMSMGVSLIVAVANVFFDDTQHLITVLLRALYFLSPILYSREMLPQWLIPWVVLNPMFGIIETMRGVFYYGTMPDWTTYALNCAGTMLVLLVGLWLFRKADDKFVYFI